MSANFIARSRNTSLQNCWFQITGLCYRSSFHEII